MNTTTGTGGHCAIAENYFIQIVGKKRWYFMNPKYSKLVSPVGASLNFIQTSNIEIEQYHSKLPIEYVDISPGDLIFVPAWYGHTIKNHGGVTIASGIQTVSILKALQNNFLYTSVVFVNNIFVKLGIAIGGYYDDGTMGVKE